MVARLRLSRALGFNMQGVTNHPVWKRVGLLIALLFKT